MEEAEEKQTKELIETDDNVEDKVITKTIENINNEDFFYEIIPNAGTNKEDFECRILLV